MQVAINKHAPYCAVSIVLTLQKLKYEIHTKFGMNWRPLESYQKLV